MTSGRHIGRLVFIEGGEGGGGGGGGGGTEIKGSTNADLYRQATCSPSFLYCKP